MIQQTLPRNEMNTRVSEQDVEPWTLKFEWNKAHDTDNGAFLCLLKDLWIVIMSRYIDSPADLMQFACSHPYFYTIVAQNTQLQDRATAQYFSKAMSTKGFQYSVQSRVCQLQAPAETGGKSSKAPNVNTAVVYTQRKASPDRPVQVDFLLHSDFQTELFMSYFNFSLISGHASDEASKLAFHYLVDGDCWNVGFQKARRNAARWLEGDIISIQIGTILVKEHGGVVNSPFRVKDQNIVRQQPHPSTKGAAVVLTPEQMREGWTVYVALYRNHQMVYDPMVFLYRPGHLALWVACKFAELKDKVEIVVPKVLPPLVLEKDGPFRKFVPSKVQ